MYQERSVHQQNIIILDRGDYTSCTVNLHGATITSWKIQNQEMVFVSRYAEFTGFSHIPGGIQFVFPVLGKCMFGPKDGFVNLMPWKLDEGPTKLKSGDVYALISLSSNPYTRSLWNYKFKLYYKITLCENSIVFNIRVENPNRYYHLEFDVMQNALMRVPDISKCEVVGLTERWCKDFAKDTIYQDQCESITFSGNINRIYYGAPQQILLKNMMKGSSLKITKLHSRNINLWNSRVDPSVTMNQSEGVPTTVDLENNSNQKKYTINRSSGRGLVISKPLCVLMAIGALLLAVLVGLIVFFLVPRYCNAEKSPEALVKNQASEATPIAVINEDDDIDERLPRSIEPTHYRIKIQPNFQNSTTSGAETITLRPIEDTNIIIFHVNNITINKHSVVVKSKKLDSKPIEINDQDYIQGQKYRIHLNEHLKTGEEYQLDMTFNGELNRHLQGFYKSQYNDRLGNERYAASTQFSPTDARRAFPCFDEPSFKAHFTISLARPSNMTTLSNMPLNTSDALSVEQNETYHWDHYPETPKMSTYLVAFLVGNLKPLSINNNGIIKIWSREEFLPYARYAAEIAPQILDYFERYFGIPYPLPKMDIVAVPEFGFSAMENWGLITFRESSLLFDPRSSTTEDMRTIANVLSHEIAHQWFGNLVTPKWWNDLWLKEGFASYLQYFGVNYTEPMWKITDEFIATETQKAMSIDALESSRPISFEVKNSRQIRQAFDEISYSKGAAIIRMMNHFLGEEVFRRGLINYLQKHQNGNADRQDLFTSLTMEAHKADVLLQNDTVKHIMDTWTERAGFPLVTAAADYENKRLHITQRRFYLNDKEERSSWWVPLSFTTSREENFEDTRPKFWLRGQYETVESAELGEWYLLNLNQTGYFIVNYDEKNWRALIDHIMDFPPIIRAQLISDSMELARANVLDYDIPLRMIGRMAVRDGDIMFVPTLIAFKKLKFLSDILSQTPAFGHFEEYHRAIFKMTYQRVTFDDIVDDYITRRIRQTVLEWSCMSPDSTCAHQSRSKFRQLMINHYDVEPNLRSIVYCTAVREGSELEWEFAYEKYLETQSPSEKNMLLDALGCTKLSWLLSRYVKKLLDDSSIRIQDADRVFESVAKNRVGTQIAFDFLRKNWYELLNHYGDGFNILAKMIKALAPHMNTEFQLLELERFKNSVKTNISTTAIAFESAIETVKSNVDWMKKNYNQVEKWFIANKDRFVYL